MASSGDVVASFDLSSSSATGTTNGYFDSVTDGMVNGGGGGDGTDSLTCDNNNNEVSKHNGTSSMTPPPQSTSDESLEGQLLQHLNTMSSVVSKDRASGDQSIDSGVTGGDSDEADCGPAMHPPPRPSSSGGGSSCSIVEEGSGDDTDDLNERHRSPLTVAASPLETKDHEFFMNGLVDHKEDDDDQSNHVAADDHDLGGSLEETSLQHGRGFEKDCNICQ